MEVNGMMTSNILRDGIEDRHKLKLMLRSFTK